MFGLHFFNEMDNFQREIDQLFRGVGLNSFADARPGRLAFKVRENEDQYVLEAAVPALNLEKLEINVLGRKLTISGEMAKAELPEGANWIVRERRAGKFEQSYHLPENLDAEKIEAHYKNGTLKLDLPKKAEAQPKKIEISIA